MANRARKNLRGDERGAAYVEMLLAFVPIFTLLMGVTQLALLYVADVVVHHAAYRAARSAVVVLDDDPRYYAGEARGLTTGAPLAVDDALHRYSRAGAGGDAIPEGLPRPRMLSRRATIELAAAMVLAPLVARRGPTSAGDALGIDSVERSIEAAIARTEVDIRLEATPRTGTTPAQTLVTVSVEHAYHCGVPIGRALVCPGGARLLRAAETLPLHDAELEYRSGDWGAP